MDKSKLEGVREILVEPAYIEVRRSIFDKIQFEFSKIHEYLDKEIIDLVKAIMDQIGEGLGIVNDDDLKIEFRCNYLDIDDNLMKLIKNAGVKKMNFYCDECNYMLVTFRI